MLPVPSYSSAPALQTLLPPFRSSPSPLSQEQSMSLPELSQIRLNEQS